MMQRITGYPPDVLALYSAELLEAHRLLDKAGIPQSGFEEQLSISQRVELLCQQNARLKAASGV